MGKTHRDSHLRHARRMRKHERMIADVIATHESDRDRFTLGHLFASTLSRDNKAFNVDAFMTAARVSPWWEAW